MVQENSEQIRLMLQIIGDGLQGLHAKGFSNEEAVSIIAKGRQYGVEALLYYLLKKNCLSIQSGTRYRNLLIENFIKQQNLGKLLQQMECDGIHAVVLKGYSLAMRYPDPSCRRSCDSDLLVDKNKEKQVFAYLRKNGFELKGKRPHTGCDSQWYRNDVGIIELHIALFNPLNTRCLFAPIINNIQFYVKKNNSDIGSIWILDNIDNLLYTFFHLTKHYLIGNVSLQMIIDFWLLYQECNNQREYLFECAEKIGQRELLDSLICFAQRYFISNLEACNREMEQKAERIYNCLFENGGQNIYKQYIKSRINQIGKVDFRGGYLYCCWKMRIKVQRLVDYLKKLVR